MIPARIEGATIDIGKPRDWDESQGRCGSLPVRYSMMGDLRFMESAWRPSPAEIEALTNGACIILSISAPQHPVVRLGVGPVPGDGEICDIRQLTAGTPEANSVASRVVIWDEDAGRAFDRMVVQIDCDAGLAVCYVTDAHGASVFEGGNRKTEIVRGNFSIRWKV